VLRAAAASAAAAAGLPLCSWVEAMHDDHTADWWPWLR